MARASTVAVVVPSPATSEVLEATSLTICAPMFSNLSSSSISLATVTPSLVTVGAPKLLSSTTLRPLGPSVTVTASARTLTPLRIFSRASCENLTILAAIAAFSPKLCWCPDNFQACGLLKNSQDVVFAQDDMLLAIELDFTAGIFAEQDFVSGFHVGGDELAVLILAAAYRHHFAFLRLLLGGIGDDNPSLGFLFLFDPFDQNAIAQRSD